VGPARLPSLEAASAPRPDPDVPGQRRPPQRLPERPPGPLPQSFESCRLPAHGGLGGEGRLAALLDWRRRIAEVSPTPENRLLLASTALRFQRPPYPLTAEILDDLRAGATNLPAFHVVSAELALRLKELDAAQAHFQAAARLEPTNELYQLNLAALRLASTNDALAAESRATLESLRQSANLGAVALGWLVEDCLRRQEFAAAAAWSAQLLAHPRCTTEQRLQCLDLLLPGKGPEFTSYLESFKQRAITNVADVRSLSTWLIQHDRAGEALRWLTNLPPAVRAQQPVPLATTEAYAALKDWAAVQGFLAGQRWADLEFMRLAFLSQASLQQKAISAPTLWRSAVREAGERLGALGILLNLADSWQRREDKEDLLCTFISGIRGALDPARTGPPLRVRGQHARAQQAVWRAGGVGPERLPGQKQPRGHLLTP